MRDLPVWHEDAPVDEKRWEVTATEEGELHVYGIDDAFSSAGNKLVIARKGTHIFLKPPEAEAICPICNGRFPYHKMDCEVGRYCYLAYGDL